MPFLAASASAQDDVFVRFDAAADREVWLAPTLGTAAPKDSTLTSAEKVQISAKGHKESESAFVWDKKSGNIAAKKLSDIRKEGTWTLKATDFKYVAKVVVKVESAGKSVAAADVKLNDGDQVQSQLLDPSLNGTVEFFGLKPGELRVTINYRADGTMASVRQLASAPLSRSEAVPTVLVALPNGAPTAEPTDAPAAEAPKGVTEEKKTPADIPGTQPANPFGSFVVFLLGVGLVGTMLYFALKYARGNQDLLAGKLEQLGVQIPKPGDDPVSTSGAVPVAPMPPKPEPPQKILLDDAAPDPIPVAAPVAPSAPAPPPAPTGIPKLVSEAGDVLELPEGETVVGRDVGLGLSLVGESTVSRKHASILKYGSSVMIKDLGSTNGTFVNGAPLAGQTSLFNGDAVQFGAVKFRYEA